MFRRAAGLAVLAAVCGAGCAGRGPAREPLVPPPPPPLSPESAGEGVWPVVYVRADQGHLVVRGERLPNPGEEATVLRGDFPVGVVRFTDQRQGHHAAADIVEGAPQPGDRVVR